MASFLQQRFYPTLRMGFRPTVARGNWDIPLHCRQGRWDGASGLHCAAMALTLLGKISDVTTLSGQHTTVAGRLWKASLATYFSGLHTGKLALLILSLKAGVKVDCRFKGHQKVLDFTKKQLSEGGLVIVTWSNREGADGHFVLVHGVEGTQSGRTFTPTALLVLDPDAAEPSFGGYNGRLEFTSHSARRDSSYITYIENSGLTQSVTLTSALAMKVA